MRPITLLGFFLAVLFPIIRAMDAGGVGAFLYGQDYSGNVFLVGGEGSSTPIPKPSRTEVHHFWSTHRRIPNNDEMIKLYPQVGKMKEDTKQWTLKRCRFQWMSMLNEIAGRHDKVKLRKVIFKHG